MPVSRNLQAYLDIEAIFERALAEEVGIKISLDNAGQVHSLALRLNTYRSLLREQNLKIYPEDDPRGRVTPYDALTVLKDLQSCALIIRRKESIDHLKIEALAE